MDRLRSGFIMLYLAVLLIASACVRQEEKPQADTVQTPSREAPRPDASVPAPAEATEALELNPRADAAFFAAEDRGPGRPGLLPRDYEIGVVFGLEAADAEVVAKLFDSLGEPGSPLPKEIIEPRWASHLERQALSFPAGVTQIRFSLLESPRDQLFLRYRGLAGEELVLGTVRGRYGSDGGLRIEDIDIEARLSPPYPALVFPPVIE
jgi:hypothetical protein